MVLLCKYCLADTSTFSAPAIFRGVYGQTFPCRKWFGDNESGSSGSILRCVNGRSFDRNNFCYYYLLNWFFIYFWNAIFLYVLNLNFILNNVIELNNGVSSMCNGSDNGQKQMALGCLARIGKWKDNIADRSTKKFTRITWWINYLQKLFKICPNKKN